MVYSIGEQYLNEWKAAVPVVKCKLSPLFLPPPMHTPSLLLASGLGTNPALCSSLASPLILSLLQHLCIMPSLFSCSS